MKSNLIKGLFITSLVISNVVTGKVLNLFGLIVPGAALCYAVTFLCTDLISELEGKKSAQQLVTVGFISSVFASLLILLTGYLPVASFAADKSVAYDLLLGQNFRFVAASMAAYWISQTWDVWFFHRLKELTKNKHRWIRNNFSTMTSQFIDTIIFILIAFYGEVPNLLYMALSQYILKIIIAGLDTPLFYLLTEKNDKK